MDEVPQSVTGVKPWRKDHTLPRDPLAQTIWDYVARSPLHNLWDFQGAPVGLVMKRAFSSFLDDNLLSRAAELGYYFLFALFPTLVSASAILGLAARKASLIYVHLLHYLAICDSAIGVCDCGGDVQPDDSGGDAGQSDAGASGGGVVGFGRFFCHTGWDEHGVLREGDAAILEGAWVGDSGDDAAFGNRDAEPGGAAGR